jgi:hypothetical protein
MQALSNLAFQIWIFGTWQLVSMAALVGVIIFYMWYRKRQM